MTPHMHARTHALTPNRQADTEQTGTKCKDRDRRDKAMTAKLYMYAQSLNRQAQK